MSRSSLQQTAKSPPSFREMLILQLFKVINSLQSSMLHMSRKILINERYRHILRTLNGTTWYCIIPCSSISFQGKRKKLGHIKVPDPFISSKQSTQLSEFGQVLDSIIIFSATKGVSFNCGCK